MTEIFLKLVNMSIPASFLVAVVVLLRLLLRKVPKWIHCLLWALVAVRLLCPFSLESRLSLMPQYQELTPAALTVQVERIEIHSSSTAHVPAANRAPAASSTSVDSQVATSANRLLPNLAAIWMAGMVLMLVYAAESYRRLRKRVDASVDLGGNVHLCDYIESPFILGVFRPVIYLPSSLTSQEAEHVLAHERSHLRRRDHWWKPLGYVLLAVYWFNPAIWLAYILLCRDIELACDEAVVKELDVDARKAYSLALLSCSVPRHMVASCPLAFGEVGVKQRVKSVLHYKKPAFWLILVATVLCCTVAVGFLTDPAAPAAVEEGSSIHLDASALGSELQLTDQTEQMLSAALQATEMTLFDPHIYGDNLFTGVAYNDGKYGLAWFEKHEAGDYRLKEARTEHRLWPTEDERIKSVNLELEETTLRVFVNWNPDVRSLFWQCMEHDPDFVVNEKSPCLFVVESTSNRADGSETFYYGQLFPVGYTLSKDETEIAFTRENGDRSGYLHSQYVVFYDGLDRPGIFNMSPEETDRLWTILESVQPQEVTTGAEEHELCVNISLICNDASRTSAQSFEFLLQYADDSVTLDLYHTIPDWDYSQAKKLKYTIRNEELNAFMASLCDRSRMEGYINVSTDEKAEYSYQSVNMSLPLPVGWEYEIVEYTDDNTPFGIRLRPEWVDEGWLFASFWPQGYTVDTIGLYTQDYPYVGAQYVFPEGATFESYIHKEIFWTCCHFPDYGGDYVILNEGADEWGAKNSSPINLMVMYSTFGAGNLRREQVSQLVSAFWADAGELQADFDWKTGQWTVTPDQGQTILVLDGQGNLLSITSTTAGQAELESITDAIAREQTRLWETETVG